MCGGCELTLSARLQLALVIGMYIPVNTFRGDLVQGRRGLWELRGMAVADFSTAAGSIL